MFKSLGLHKCNNKVEINVRKEKVLSLRIFEFLSQRSCGNEGTTLRSLTWFTLPHQLQVLLSLA